MSKKINKFLFFLLICFFSGSVVSAEEDASSYFKKGVSFYNKKEYKKAAPSIIRAAEMGHAEAQMHLGKMYFNGWGVKHNHATAKTWHEKAAAQGNEESKRKLENFHHKETPHPIK